MDAKSLAKSKRAHSQHHQNKRTHPHPKPKPQTPNLPADPNSKNPSAKQAKSRGSSSSGLPSNWDRYEDEFDSASEVPIQASDVVVPKSKGADFAYLISEAQSQLETRCSNANLGGVASFDDVLPDFNQGVSSILSVRGKSILSWTGDDNFFVDDDSTTGYEASFLSMDLHSLAAQLAKLDVSQRLFIEEDILPPELMADRSKKKDVSETCAKAVPKHYEEILGSANVEKSFDGSSKDNRSATYSQDFEFVDQASEVSTADASGTSVPIFHYRGDKLVDATNIDCDQVEETDSRALNAVPLAEPKETKTPTYEVVVAETELDMLLNSFGETDFLDSSSISKKSTNSSPDDQLDDSSSLSKGLPSVCATIPPKQVSTLPNANLDDIIDDLLEETSSLKNKDALLDSQAATVTPYIPAKSSQPTTIVLDDFDSWLDTI